MTIGTQRTGLDQDGVIHVPTKRHRNECSVGDADHACRLCHVEHAERNPKIRVRQDVVVDRCGRPLGSKDEVNSVASSTLRDIDDLRDEVGHLLDQGGELVNHDRK